MKLERNGREKKLTRGVILARVIFHMKGAIYSTNKYQWKKVLKAYEMEWKGTMENWIWIKEGEKLIAYFDRDMTVGDRGVTLDAYLMWESKYDMTDFGEAFIDFWEAIDGAEKVDMLPDEKRGETPEQQLADFDKKMRAQYENHVRQKAPEGFLNAFKRDWQIKRKDRMKELGITENVDEAFF